MFRRCRREAGQRQRRRQYVLAKACVRVLGVERVDQQSVMLLYRRSRGICQLRRRGHLLRNPALLCGPLERFFRRNHDKYFML